ncbi:MAG: CheR family methyltransferase [Anaerolineae bacterium]
MTDADYTIIGRRIEQLYGIDLDCYKSTQMRRRLDAYLLRVRANSWAEYFRRLETEVEERQRFKDYLTINVTSFFRDADKFQVLEQQVIPGLAAGGRQVNIWSAGCSDGPEAYTLAILFQTVAPATRFHIWATDLDPKALAKAKARGPYLPDTVEAVPKAHLTRYFESADGNYKVKAELQRNITFQEHNLLRDPIRDRFDLIVCRNVIIYFTEEAKLALFARFCQALKPDGVLFIGATETIPLAQARELGLDPIRVSFYRRLQPAKMDIGAR